MDLIYISVNGYHFMNHNYMTDLWWGRGVFYAKGTEFVNIYINSGFEKLTRVWVQRQNEDKTDAMQVRKIQKNYFRTFERSEFDVFNYEHNIKSARNTYI
jgi:hypothetical protein